MTSIIIEKPRVAVYIDGGNFFKYLRSPAAAFPKGTKFDYSGFVNYLVNNRALVSKRYYIGITRNVDGTEKSEEIVRAQQNFLAVLSNDGFAIKRGRIMYDGNRIREKGTDVKIAIDMVVGAASNFYDVAILASSDTDLIPAIKYLKFCGKRFEYVGFEHTPSYGMDKLADVSILLAQKDLEKFKLVD